MANGAIVNRLRAKLKLFLNGRQGSAMLELAVAFPLLLFLAIGAGDYARFYKTGIQVANAARAGAQYGAQNDATSGDISGMRAAAINDGDNTIAVTPSQFCSCPDGTTPICATGLCGASGAPQVFVKVVATKTINTTIRYPGLRTSLTARDSAILRVQ